MNDDDRYLYLDTIGLMSERFYVKALQVRYLIKLWFPTNEVRVQMEMQMYIDEVKNLHKFIQDWLTGSVPKTEEAFSCFRDALDTDFVIVHPTGVAEHCEELVKGFWSAHGVREKSFTIEIRNLNHRLTFGDFALVTYEEWQFDKTTTGRVSSVLFRKPEKENKVRWVHLHETWIST